MKLLMHRFTAARGRTLLDLILVVMVGLGGPLASVATAFDWKKATFPEKWVRPLVPEEESNPKYPAYFGDFDKAQAQMMAGLYRRSLVTLEKAKDADPLESALVKAKSLWALGRTDEALAALAPQAIAADARAQVLRAQVLGSIGKTDEAIAALKAHLQAHPDSIAGHFQLGQMCEQAGDLQSAKAAYAWFIDNQDYLNKWQGGTAEVFDSAESVTTIARAIDRWASLTGAYQNNDALHNLLLNMCVKAYDVIDRAYWPAHVAAAEYYLSHDNKQEAAKELTEALAANPNDIDALRLMGQIALDTYNFDGADQMIEAIRDVNPHSSAADLIEARNFLQQRRPEDAHPAIERVLKQQPKNLEALGLLAATWSLQLDDAKSAAVLKQVEAIDPDNATAYFELAEQLGAMRQYPRAAENYKIAIERAPWWTAPRNGLGLLYTQSGDEDDARVTLDAAHALDPFNLATTNYLRLLDDMAKFARAESAHFIVLYDAKADPVIPEYFGEYLESIYADVCGQFHHEPKVKTYIEVFPTHAAFSVRTTGSPWIGTVGASTGRVIALVSPRAGKQTMGPFNWSAVLRHEFTHTVTLSATDNRIAHWMTEGLAVEQEQAPLRWEWVPMLNDAVKKKKLFSMESLTWAFVRPRRPIDRQLAYAQSFWICQYIDQKYGRDAILKMMDVFRAGKSQAEVFQTVLKMSPDAFSKEFFAWTDEQVKGWGYDEATKEKVEQIKPKADAAIENKQWAEALPLWEQMEKLRPMDQQPHSRLAALYLKLDKPDAAVKELKILNAVELHDNRYAKAIARILRDEGHLKGAVEYAKKSVYIDPYDGAAHELLAEVYEKSDNQPGLSKERRVIAMLKEWKQMQARPAKEDEQPLSGPPASQPVE